MRKSNWIMSPRGWQWNNLWNHHPSSVTCFTCTSVLAMFDKPTWRSPYVRQLGWQHKCFWHLLVDHVPSLVAAGDLGFVRIAFPETQGITRCNAPIWSATSLGKMTECFVNLWIVRMECLDMFERLQYVLPYLGLFKEFRFRFGQLALKFGSNKKYGVVFWKEPLNASAWQPYVCSSWPSQSYVLIPALCFFHHGGEGYIVVVQDKSNKWTVFKNNRLK